jgi:hypothetical protein
VTIVQLSEQSSEEEGQGLLLIYRTLNFEKLFEGTAKTHKDSKIYFTTFADRTLMLHYLQDKFIFTQFKTDHTPWTAQHTHNIQITVKRAEYRFSLIDDIITLCDWNGKKTYIFDMQRMVKEGLDKLNCNSKALFKVNYRALSAKR